MNSARRLLIPIDFSDASKAVVEYALSNKKYNNDSLILLHSYRLIADDFSSYHDSPRDLKKMLESKHQDAYNTFYQGLALSGRSFELEFRMEVGFIVNTIYSICKESPIDMILYTLKLNKENQILQDLLALDCAPIMLISENVGTDSRRPLAIKEIPKQVFNSNWDHYINELESNPGLSYTVMPF